MIKTIILSMITVILWTFLTISALEYFDKQDARIAKMEKEIIRLHIASIFMTKDGVYYQKRGKVVKEK